MSFKSVFVISFFFTYFTSIWFFGAVCLEVGAWVQIIFAQLLLYNLVSFFGTNLGLATLVSLNNSSPFLLWERVGITCIVCRCGFNDFCFFILLSQKLQIFTELVLATLVSLNNSSPFLLWGRVKITCIVCRCVFNIFCFFILLSQKLQIFNGIFNFKFRGLFGFWLFTKFAVVHSAWVKMFNWN